MLLGDVGVSGIRTPNAVHEAVPLATFSIPVAAAVQGPWLKGGRAQILILGKAPGGATRIVSLSGEPATYKIAR